MDKKIEDYLHLYIGCQVAEDYSGKGSGKLIGVDLFNRQAIVKHNTIWPFDFLEVKPILRPLFDMTEDEAVQLLQVLFQSPSDVLNEIKPDEISLDLVLNDDGLLVDDNCAVVLDFSCRCYEGQLGILKDGSLSLFDDSGKPDRLSNMPEGFRYLLTQQFDLFNLIESGLAISKTPINDATK